MNTPQSRSRTAVAAAVGAGVMVGAAGLITYFGMEYLRKQKALQDQLHRKSQFSRETRKLREIEEDKTSDDLESEVPGYSDCFSHKDEKSDDSDSEEYFDCFSHKDEKSDDSDSEEYFDCDSEESSWKAADSDHMQKQERKKKLFAVVDKLFEGEAKDRLKAFNILKSNKSSMSGDVEFMWRLAKAYQIHASAYGCEGNEAKKKQFIEEGLKFASEALQLDSTCPEAHKWFAVLTGMHGDDASMKEKIRAAKDFYDHVTIAIQSQPDDYYLHHLLGRYKFEVANTPWVLRKLAAAVFGENLDHTVSDALVHLTKAEKLNPSPCIANRLLLAKCFIVQGEKNDALQWLCKASAVAAMTLEESALLEEVNVLLEQLEEDKV